MIMEEPKKAVKRATNTRTYTQEMLAENKIMSELLDETLVFLQRIQDKMFEKFTELNVTNNNFYDLSKLDKHLALCQHFSDSFECSQLETIYGLWNCLFERVIKLERNLRKYFVTVPKRLAAFCILEGRYYCAVSLLYDAVQLNPADLSVWFTLLWWTVFLDDWALLGILLKREDMALQNIERSEGYSAFIDCCRLVYSFHVYRLHETDPHEIACEILEKLKAISLLDKKTYLFSSCKALLRNVLVAASRLRMADLRKIGDPLHNRALEAETCELILQNRLPQFSKLEESVSISILKKVTKADEFNNADEFLRLCSSLADYFESYHRFVDELFDVGLVREAEAHSISLWMHGLYIGVPYRVIRSLSFIFYMKSITTIERHLLDNYAECLNALLTPSSAIAADEINTLKNALRQSLRQTKRVDNILMDDAIYTVDSINDEMNYCQISSVNPTEEPRQKIELIAHCANCDCAFCCLSNIENAWNWQFSLEWLWIKLMYSAFDRFEFDEFRQSYKMLQKSYAKEREKFWRSVTAKPGKYEEFLSPLFTERWITGCTCVVLESVCETQLRIPMVKSLKDFYLREAINLSKQSLMRFRSSHLLLTLLLRQSDYDDFNSQTICLAVTQLAAQASKFNVNDVTSAPLIVSKTAAALQPELPKAIQLSYSDQKEFGHLFFREWRQRNCLFLAKNLKCAKWSWHRAMYFIETGTPSVRQCTRTCCYGKSTNFVLKNCNKSTKKVEGASSTLPLPKFYFDSSDELIKFVKNLPEDTTLLNFTVDDAGVLWLVRCHMSHDPIVVSIANICENNEIVVQMRKILMQSDNSVSTNSTDSAKFWATRRKLDKEIQKFVDEWQDLWFGELSPLLIPLAYESNPKKSRLVETLRNAERKFNNFGFTRQSATTLVHFCGELDRDEWLGLVKGLARLDSVSLNMNGEDVKGKNELMSKIENFYKIVRNHVRSETRIPQKKYTLLVVPPKLSFLPWECLPIYKHSPLVSRIPSVHFFDHLLNSAKTLPKKVDSSNSFYVLDPSGDLANTQKRMTSVLEKFQWNGVVGKIPTRKEIQSVLADHDLFLYMGHGSGGRYFGRSSIRESDCKAVSVLMGCSSVCIIDEGTRFDGRASLYEYLIAKCPCVVGCLWMVTDGEIDRFFMGLIEYCFNGNEKSPKTDEKLPKETASTSTSHRSLRSKTSKSNESVTDFVTDIPVDANKENVSVSKRLDAYKLLVEGVVEARKACKLPYLTGCAVVCYGLPILSKSVPVLSSKTNVS